MANIVKIKRSVTTNTPVSLTQGEIAYSEVGSPNGEGEFFIGTAGSAVTKITTTILTGTDGVAAQPNSSTQNNQTLTTGTGIAGADGGSAAGFSMSLDLSELGVATPVTGDWLAFDNAGVSNKALISAISLSLFSNDSGWTSNVGTVTAVTGGTGLTSSGGVTPALSVDYLGVDNIIDAATDLEGVAIATTDTILYHDATDTNVKKGLVSDLPFGAGTGDITAVNITAGVGLSGTVSTASGDHTQTLALDFSELTDMTAAIAGTTEFVVQNGVTESRKAASEIALGFFSNNLGWTTNTGTVTSVTGGVGVTSSGGVTPSISLNFAELTDKTTDIAGTTEFILQDGATESRKTANEIKLSFFNNDAGWESNDVNEVLTTSTGAASWNWILDEDLFGSNSATHVPTQQSVKAYVDNAVTGGLTHKGGYNASTNTPALDTGSPVLSVGDMYTVTVAGTFFTVALEVGDVLIADVASVDAASIADWTIVQANIGSASETVAGYIQLATQAIMNTASNDVMAVTPLKYANSTIDGGSF
jgi:hypothetical protein